MGAFIDLTGKTFGRLTVLRKGAPVHKKGTVLVRRTRWICLCACGKTSLTHADSLRSGRTKSCGCLGLEGRHPIPKTEGESLTRRCYESMIARCCYAGNKNYPLYGLKGITVCDRWRNSFDNFVQDMGYRPSRGHTIDRIDNSFGYFTKNCRWATMKEQQNNRMNNRIVVVDGIKTTVALAAEAHGISSYTVYCRMDRGWSDEAAVKIKPFSRSDAREISPAHKKQLIKLLSDRKLSNLIHA